jgi:integrase
MKRKFLHWLKDHKGLSTSSIDMVAAAISRFEEFTGYRDFKRFRIEDARKFKVHLAEKVTGIRSEKPLSKATITSTLRHLKTFFMWLADRPGYRSRIRVSDAQYFTPLGQDERIARAHNSRSDPDLEDVRKAILAMPTGSDDELRDRAIMAFILLTAARDQAVVSLKLKHVHLEDKFVHQDAREVKTKRAKTFSTGFIPVGEDILTIFEEWIDFLKRQKGYSPEDPLFPKTRIGRDGSAGFAVLGIEKKHWSTTTPIRNIFKTAFERVGLPYYNPHSVRTTVTRLGERLCRDPEQFKSWSQNLGHEHVHTTFSSYGKVPEHRQLEIIRNMWRPKDDRADLAQELAAFLLSRKGRL